jgi:hypothetical protein
MNRFDNHNPFNPSSPFFDLNNLGPFAYTGRKKPLLEIEKKISALKE